MIAYCQIIIVAILDQSTQISFKANYCPEKNYSFVCVEQQDYDVLP